MHRVVVTGMGVISSIGNSKAEVADSLRQGKSGLRYMPTYREAGLRSWVAGPVGADPEGIDRKQLRFMGDAALYAYRATEQAIADAGLPPDLVSHPLTGCVIGSGGASTEDIVQANQLLEAKGVRRVGPYRVSKTMASTASAAVATFFEIKGLNYSISSACATGGQCIGHAYEQIQLGKQNIVFAGGAESEDISQSCLFDAMGAFSTAFNATPETASRPYDRDRDGFVISGGAGVLVLEELDHARARGANLYGEVVGYGTASDGYDMVSPSGDGAWRSMAMALTEAGRQVDYLNTHGTSTPAGDLVELEAARAAFAGELPRFSSTKALTGHSLGAAGAQEAIYCLLMLELGFMAGSFHIENPDPGVTGLPLLRESLADEGLKTVMSNSFGFGGTNTSLVFSRLK